MSTSVSTASKFDLPPASNGHPTPVADTHRLVRERGFLPSTSLADICAHLNDSGATGTLLIDFSQGAMNSIRFREEKKIDLTSK